MKLISINNNMFISADEIEFAGVEETSHLDILSKKKKMPRIKKDVLYVRFKSGSEITLDGEPMAIMQRYLEKKSTEIL